MADKPKLIKFSCSTCGTRLAVPLELAGVEDQCPKCGNVVVSPALPAPAQLSQPAAIQEAPAIKSVVPQGSTKPLPVGQAPAEESADLGMPSLEDVLRNRPATSSRLEDSAPPMQAPAAPKEDLASMAPDPEVERRASAERELWNAVAQAAPLSAPARRPIPVIESPPSETKRAAAAEIPHEPVKSAPLPRNFTPPEAHQDTEDHAGKAHHFSIGDLLDQGTSHQPATRAQAKGNKIDFRKVVSASRQTRGRSKIKLIVGIGIAAFLLLDLTLVAWFSRGWLFGSKQNTVSKPVATAPAGSKEAKPNAKNESAVGKQKETEKITTNSLQPPSAAVTPEPPIYAGQLTPGPSAPSEPAPKVLISPVTASESIDILKLAEQTAAKLTEGRQEPIPPVKLESPTITSVPLSVEPLTGSGKKLDPDAKELPKPSAIEPSKPADSTMIAPTVNPGIEPVSLTGGAVLASVSGITPPVLTVDSSTAKPSQTAVLDPVDEPVTAPSSTTNNLKLSAVPVEAEPALAALNSFLNAANWRERLKWSQKPEAARSAMEKYYQGSTGGPIKAGRIDFLKRYPAAKGAPAYCMFEVTGGDIKHPVLALVEQISKNEARVDWEAFMEFKDEALEKFLQTKDAPASRFRVMIRRQHSYDKDVPDLLLKDCFELFQPRKDFTARVFCPKGGATQRQLSTQLPWDMEMAVIVELAWRKKGRYQWVEIASVPNYGWKS